ncbi:hypothetical protein HDV05_006249, partial [Chytridiales sp. JEL 0842]
MRMNQSMMTQSAMQPSYDMMFNNTAPVHQDNNMMNAYNHHQNMPPSMMPSSNTNMIHSMTPAPMDTNANMMMTGNMATAPNNAPKASTFVHPFKPKNTSFPSSSASTFVNHSASPMVMQPTHQSDQIMTHPIKEFRASPNQPAPTLLELFTSEGCSSCPPSERYLNSLRSSNELWKSIVPVSFHVDYWNYLGWDDSLSSREWTVRQRAYAGSWGSGRVYTPCFVRDGLEFGSRASTGGVLQGRQVHSEGELVVRFLRQGQEGLEFEVEWTPAQPVRGQWVFHLALLGNGIQHRIGSGENRGEVLEHEFAVLAFKEGVLGDGKMSVTIGAGEVLGRKEE